MKKILVVFSIFILAIATISQSGICVVYASAPLYNANAYYLMESVSGKVLMEHNAEKHLQVASMVKLMTSLITIEKIEAGELNLTDKVIASEYACSMEGSQAFLDANKEYYVEDLLKSVIMASANDSSVVLAEMISGTESNFVELMNKKAKLLNMNNTLYANCTGLPSVNEYSCAKDIAILLNEVKNHKLYFNYSSIWMDELVHESGRKTELVNTNRLVREYSGCDIGKTGFTDEAGYCLSASASKNNMRLISVVMGTEKASDRFTITTNLLNYGFANFENKIIVNNYDNIPNNIKLCGSVDTTINLKAERSFGFCNKKGDKINYEIEYQLPKKIIAPIKTGEVVGKIIILDQGKVLDEINIISADNYNAITFKQSFEKIVNNWFI